MKYPLLAKIDDNGKCIFANPNQATAEFGRLKGKEVIVTVEEKQDWKTYLQLGYWWGYVVDEARLGWIDLGEPMSKGDVHLRLMDALMREPLINAQTGDPICDKRTGEVKYKTRNMSTLTKDEMMSLITRMQQYCAENLGCYVKDPDKDWRINKKKKITIEQRGEESA